MVGFFLVQCFLAPFLDPVSNASEWTSRMNYVLTSVIALGVALNLPGQTILNDFTVINWSITQRLVKKLARRIDFSIDIFSPRLDLSPTSAHIRRRIWQEAISVLILTNPECGIPKIQPMQFAQARDSEYPPYLLAFAGSPGERHVENLKVTTIPTCAFIMPNQ
ncbi:hypothetical protein PHLCEN_2v499 [Hermanssonia centrifuga]|uniref:Uncharacterized protein n=1 Tax=Hermanssonia centrifuga TaxID=98765 RepID=A0A2R6S5Z4_9APHY|nr:hypothetical protein PHLCEN_2v499 [Hermanssonia centrifuga]